MKMVISNIRDDELKKLLAASVKRKLQVIGIALCNELKIEDSRIGNKKGVSPSPAPPGGPPAKVTGQLARSWTYKITGTVLRVGSPLMHALYQELGWRQRVHGLFQTDAHGNRIRTRSERDIRAENFEVPARPTLRPVLRKNWGMIGQILRGG